MAKKKIIVIGGGFAGSHIAKHLEKYMDVTLIDTKNYFEFTPGILRTIVDPSHIRKIQVLHSHYLKWARILVGKVKEVSKDYVLFGKEKLKFDYLIIASGSSYNAPFKDFEVITATRASDLRKYYENLCKARKVLIIGGGLVGVELAGEICDKYPNKDLTIVHSQKHLISRNNMKAIDCASNYLKSRGVKIIYGEKIISKDKKKFITDKGREIKTDMAFLCTGIIPNYEFIEKKYLGEKGIKVNKYLQIEGKDNFFVAGDVNNIKEEKTGQNAERQAEVIVKNIFALEKTGKLVEYNSKQNLLIISLGKHKGILTKGNFTWYGWVPALMKRWIERWEMWKKRRIS